MFICEGCGRNDAHIARVRHGMATYWCAACMNEEMDRGWEKGDTWVATPPGSTTGSGA